MIASELAVTIEFLRRLAEHASRASSGVSAGMKTQWGQLERRLLLDLRAEERAASTGSADPLCELKVICSNEPIRNLAWTVSVSLELQAPRRAAVLKLAELLQARARSATRLNPAA